MSPRLARLNLWLRVQVTTGALQVRYSQPQLEWSWSQTDAWHSFKGIALSSFKPLLSSLTLSQNRALYNVIQRNNFFWHSWLIIHHSALLLHGRIILTLGRFGKGFSVLQRFTWIESFALLWQTLDNSGKFMAHTDGTAEMSPDVARLLPCSVFKGKVGTPKVCFQHG